MLSRIILDNQIYFVTTKTFGNAKIFSDENNCELFIRVLKDCKGKYKFRLYGFVIIPDHIHLLIGLNNKINISEIIHSQR
ncbi:MAG: hypothetical protein A3J62_01980 [Candidatus Buchananbacteria bacterium RIFCSPHIGHO2_02_FULL_38_8]|uniref:Transposase IS200-like domain-containing protein n=2 Tax=Candidatus Buchananiibacteriota TaxID=1817903 RepID=A0A1G1Y0H4_9BACT|nr:MAG: hypothetical protein A2731_00280 [Candidatus Buchananbacteria bacterium RIFCSPHIGHO2_01_FULL_39_8]OGY46810.1 MAG: hypothetical protein A3J62_01980 [Candidatus Buchananbacteria bacterium RIFCSPHIGHO2_02_FULL_38_8]